MNLLGVSDTNCCFSLIVMGAYRRENDSSVFSNSSLEKAFSSGDFNIHPMRNIPGTSIRKFSNLSCRGWSFLPVDQLYETFPRRQLDFAKTIFIGQLSSTRRTTERAFWLSDYKFRYFSKLWNQCGSDRVYNQKCMCCLQFVDKQLKSSEGRKKYWNNTLLVGTHPKRNRILGSC